MFGANTAIYTVLISRRYKTTSNWWRQLKGRIFICDNLLVGEWLTRLSTKNGCKSRDWCICPEIKCSVFISRLFMRSDCSSSGCSFCCPPVSVRLSVCRVGVLYPHSWRYRQTSFSSGSPIILVFWPPAPVPNSKGNTFSRGAKYTGVGKCLRFSTEIAVYLGKDTT